MTRAATPDEIADHDRDLLKHEPRPQPRVTDNDAGEITVTFNDKELRGWSYASDDQRRTKMLAAREYVEGWCDGRDTR